MYNKQKTTLGSFSSGTIQEILVSKPIVLQYAPQSGQAMLYPACKASALPLHRTLPWEVPKRKMGSMRWGLLWCVLMLATAYVRARAGDGDGDAGHGAGDGDAGDEDTRTPLFVLPVGQGDSPFDPFNKIPGVMFPGTVHELVHACARVLCSKLIITINSCLLVLSTP